jgi:hypothetical protein
VKRILPIPVTENAPVLFCKQYQIQFHVRKKTLFLEILLTSYIFPVLRERQSSGHLTELYLSFPPGGELVPSTVQPQESTSYQHFCFLYNRHRPTFYSKL